MSVGCCWYTAANQMKKEEELQEQKVYSVLFTPNRECSLTVTIKAKVKVDIFKLLLFDWSECGMPILSGNKTNEAKNDEVTD